MKERHFFSKYLILTIILFTFLFLFSATSFALIPGDFGSAGGGPPDGCVDFEDLMIFALAYGSSPGDPNWNPACDIAGPGGSLIPDGVIDFEDLMVFAMNYGENEDEDIQRIIEIHDLSIEKLNEIVESPNVDINETLETLGEYLEEQGGIDNIVVNGDVLKINYDSGITSYLHLHNTNSTNFDLNGGSSGIIGSKYTHKKQIGINNSIDFKSTIANLINSRNGVEPEYLQGRKILVWVPFAEEFREWGFDIIPELEQRFEEANLDFTVMSLPDTEANINSLKSNNEYDMVIFNTHGEGGESFCTGEAIDDIFKYEDEVHSGYITFWYDDYIDETGKVKLNYANWGINASWFSEEANNLSGNFSNTIIVNLSCQSAYDSEGSNAFWQVFNDRGVGTYFGFTETAKERFAVEQCYDLVEKMRDGKITSGQAYEAKDDPYRDDGLISTWVIWGNENLKFPHESCILNVPYRTTTIHNGCLCAAGAMVFSYYGIDLSQEYFADMVIESDSFLNILFNADDFGNPLKMVDFAKSFGFSAELSFLTIDEIKQKLEEGVPIIVLQYSDADRNFPEGLHYRVIIGYDDELQAFIASCSQQENYPISYTSFLSLNVIPNNLDICPSIIIESDGLRGWVDVDPKSGEAPHEVSFTGFICGGVIPYTYQWDFGDGNWSQKGSGNQYLNIYHTYEQADVYSPILHVEDGNGNEKQFKTAEVTVTSVTPETFTITASAGPNGSINPSGSVTVNQGSDKSFTITPDTGHYIADVLVDGSSIGAVSSYTFTNVTEDHTISATFISEASGSVHNLTKDTYYDTIQAALDDADNNNTIEVSDGIYDESITFPSGKKIILQSVNGPAYTIIRGNNGSRTITSGSSTEVILTGFTITHISGQTGCGIENDNNSNMTINNCTISNNIKNTSDGGGIYNGHDSTLTITGSTISGNSATVSCSGGIINSGNMTIIDCSICNNYALNGGGGISNPNGTLTITGSTISGNTAAGKTVTFGGQHWDGGGIWNWGGTLTITGSTISNNTAVNGNGGGISIGGTLTITGSTISGNSASINGGGIYLAETGTITIGGSNNTDTGNFNEFTNNYKIGSPPSPDQHICEFDGDCHEDYPYNYFTPDSSGAYALRDIGPAGGYIFYDKGGYSNGWRYLEAAPVSTEWTEKEWGSYLTFIGGTETVIGTGQSNTTIIVTWLNNHSEIDRAAQVCDALVYGGYSDWFLPSKDELNLMHTNLEVYGVGDFADDDYYWSSSENNAYDACLQYFDYGSQYYGLKYYSWRVRAVRAF